ncbi:MAG: RiPP maturation radical SAM C-methyltransferase [Acidobacteriota bacterium]
MTRIQMNTPDDGRPSLDRPPSATKGVVLVSMPFGSAFSPSIGLSLLKAALDRDGLPCEIRYFNQQFAARIGDQTYERVSTAGSRALLGDWIFAASLFGDRIPPPGRYFADILHSRRGELVDNDRETVGAEEDARALLAVRAEVEPFLDECMERVSWERFAMVGFTTLHFQTTASLALAKRLKQRYPHLIIVFGGQACEGEMGLTLHRLFPFVDFVCSGEGDIAFPILASEVLSGEPVGEIPRIVRRVDGQTVVPRSTGAPIRDLDALPFPRYDDFVEQWSAAGLKTEREPYLLIETARGCWWGEKSHCTFCGLNGESMQSRIKSPGRAMAEFRDLVARYQPGEIKAVDNILDMRYFKDVLPQLAAMPTKPELFFEVKANLKREQVRQLHEAGVTAIQPGVENFSASVLRLMRKGLSPLQNIALLRWCDEYFIEPYWNILAGFPGEDPAEYARQAELLPLLTHLPAPQGLGLVRLDRFSPLYFDAEAMGVERVRPHRTYRYIYPLPEADLAGLAYFFDFDYADGRDPAGYLGAMRDGVSAWMKPAVVGHLVSFVHGDTLMVYDTRPVALQREYQLTGLRRAVYEWCDRAHTEGELFKTLGADEALSASLWPADPRAALSAALTELVAARLLLREEQRYLTLSVWVDFQLDVLAHRHVQNQPLTKRMSQARARFFDPRMPALKAAFAARTVAAGQVQYGW